MKQVDKRTELGKGEKPSRETGKEKERSVALKVRAPKGSGRGQPISHTPERGPDVGEVTTAPSLMSWTAVVSGVGGRQAG